MIDGKYPKPWSIQIEMTEGCNRRCTFCGIHSLYREKEDMIYKDMTVETAKAMAKDLNAWLGKVRIEFALQGEPLLNKDAFKIIKAFRDYFPKAQLMLTTNCDPISNTDGFDQNKVKKLFSCGLNMLVADYYEPNRYSYDGFFKKWKDNELGIPTFDFYKDKPKVWGYESCQMQKIVVIDNTENRDFYRNLNNQAGNTDPELIKLDGYKIEKLPLLKRCHLPFRELVIKYDGSVMICCMDWSREGFIGSFPEKTYKQIWESKPLNDVRRVLLDGRRDLLVPCNTCNYHPVKVGLITSPYDENNLPDLMETAKSFKTHQDNHKHKMNKYAFKRFEYGEVTK